MSPSLGFGPFKPASKCVLSLWINVGASDGSILEPGEGSRLGLPLILVAVPFFFAREPGRAVNFQFDANTDARETLCQKGEGSSLSLWKTQT